MANKKVLFGGRVVKVENRCGFDKSRLNALTTGVGTITPILKQLVIPSSGRVLVAIHAELPPLATDAFLRTHLKLEAFFVPMRLCYAGVQSWLAGEEVFDHASATFKRAELPFGFIPTMVKPTQDPQNPNTYYVDAVDKDSFFGKSTLTDYFNVKFHYDGNGHIEVPEQETAQIQHHVIGGCDMYGMKVNIFPYLCYSLIYHHYYRNKQVQKPLFAPPVIEDTDTDKFWAAHLPFVSTSKRLPVVLGSQMDMNGGDYVVSDFVSDGSGFTDKLLDSYNLVNLRQRNYGDDYFTCARPQAQAGNPVQVQTDENGRFTIASIRLQNALQEFAENQSYASPDYVQSIAARYGANLSDGVAQKPIILGSADFPMFTKGVEQTSASEYATGGYSDNNPFINQGLIGATAGKASANGSEFVCDFNVNEPGYIMVMATLVPEANYGEGIAHDMRIFINEGNLTDLPCGLLEHVGDEPIYEHELFVPDDGDLTRVFGYVQRYLWHKAGGENEVHGLFRPRQSLNAFIPQRLFERRAQISSAFLQIPKTALDSVAATTEGISNYGVMMDCSINMSVSEPLSESALPALSNPAVEHGRSVYLKNGGSKLA